MRNVLRIGFIAALAAAACFQQASAQQADIDHIASTLRNRVTAGATLESMRQGVRSDFHGLDADQDGSLTRADADFHRGSAEANARSQAAARIMRADLDGDGAVTEDELRRQLRYERRQWVGRNVPPGSIDAAIEAEIRRLMAADADKDGRITYVEASRFGVPAASPAIMRGSPAQRTLQFLMLDGNTDQRVTPDEVDRAVELLFRAVDLDGNGTLSQDEAQQFHARVSAIPEHENLEGCQLPKPSAASKLVLLSTYRTDAIANVTIGSQDVVTYTGTIVVEEGTEPLYLVVSTFSPAIWRVTGATERIERIVLAGTMTGPNRGLPEEVALTGVTGVSSERVTFLQRARCIPFFGERTSTAGAAVIAAVRRLTGKEPGTVSAAQGAAGFVVPSGLIRTTPPDEAYPRRNEFGSEQFEYNFRRTMPGGVVEIDPAAVVASRPVERYEVLPMEAGLIQLLKAGKISINASREILIREKIRIPAGLSGAHSVKFLLLRGVPVPEGLAGHSQIISEETGMPIGRRR